MSSMAVQHPLSMPMSSGQRTCDISDDKYMKSAKLSTRPEVKPFSLCLRDLSAKDFKVLAQSPLQLYVVFLMAATAGYHFLGGNFMASTNEYLLGYVSCIAETLGLLSLQFKIERQRSVKGISGATMVMYAIIYVLRQWLLMPPLSLLFIDGWLTELLQIPSIILVLLVVRSIFVTYRSSYQDDLDVLRIKHLVPMCLLVALPIHPSFTQGLVYSYMWTSYLYMDVFGLLPQVVFMARSNGRIEAPIAHFVAATALSRMVDLWFWSYTFDLGPQGYVFGFNYSGWLIVAAHIVSLVLVADFMYYYVKARLSGSRLSEDLALPLEV